MGKLVLLFLNEKKKRYIFAFDLDGTILLANFRLG